MKSLQLYMVLLGCKPAGRNTEQHDVFFSIGNNINELVPSIVKFWPEAHGKIHLDAWRELTQVGEFDITIKVKDETTSGDEPGAQLFFINLGGYKPAEFEEFHYKMTVAANNKGEAIQQAKKTAFYRHVGFAGANSHVDDKYGVDVDDLYEIEDILPSAVKERFSIVLTKRTEERQDVIHLGYMKLDNL